MSFVNFNSIFNPSEEEKARQEEFMEIIHRAAVEDRKTVKLVPDGDGVLHCRDPFRGFLGDCEYCSQYYDPRTGVCTGGTCMLHNIGCGYGFTCRDNDSEWAVKIKEDDND